MHCTDSAILKGSTALPAIKGRLKILCSVYTRTPFLHTSAPPPPPPTPPPALQAACHLVDIQHTYLLIPRHTDWAFERYHATCSDSPGQNIGYTQLGSTGHYVIIRCNKLVVGGKGAEFTKTLSKKFSRGVEIVLCSKT